jgi:hypothetical protein
MHIKVWLENPNGSNHSEDLGVDGKVILAIDFKEIGWKGMDCISLVQDRDRRRALVNTVMKPCDSIQCWDLLAI